jgi:hypothetical protein
MSLENKMVRVQFAIDQKYLVEEGILKLPKSGFATKKETKRKIDKITPDDDGIKHLDLDKFAYKKAKTSNDSENIAEVQRK